MLFAMAMPSDAAGRVVIVGRGKRVNLIQVARIQRAMIVVVLVTLVLAPLQCAGLMSARGAGTILDQAPFIVLSVLGIGAAIALMVYVVRLSLTTGSSVVFMVFAILGMLAGVLAVSPVISVLVTLIVNWRATRLLKQHGVRVGLMGVAKDELGRLVQDACPSCGYDVRGLALPICPECGGVLSKRALDVTGDPNASAAQPANGRE